MYKVTKDDLENTITIIKEELKLKPLLELPIEIENLAETVLNICYSIGGAYVDYTIREIVKVKLKEYK